MTIPNSTYRILVEKLGDSDPNQFIGNEGEVFYDPNNPVLKLSDGQTSGGLHIGSIGNQNGNSGDITFEQNRIIGSGSASGDGNGYSTIELVPDFNLYDNQQYIVIDPTTPNHIHVRAGGTQDFSNAELYLGGENNHVKVTDYGEATLYTKETSDTSFTYFETTDYTSAVWSSDGSGGSYLDIVTTNFELVTNLFNLFNRNENVILINTSGTSIILNRTGFTDLGNDTYRIYSSDVPSPTPQSVDNITITIFDIHENRVSIQSGDCIVEVRDDIYLTGGNNLSIRNNSQTEPISIIANYDLSGKSWGFYPDGTLMFPDGNVQITGITSTKTDNWDASYGWGDHNSVGYLKPNVETAPATPISSGTKGEVRYDSGYVYICVDTDTWIRSAIDNTWT